MRTLDAHYMHVRVQFLCTPTLHAYAKPTQDATQNAHYLTTTLYTCQNARTELCPQNSFSFLSILLHSHRRPILDMAGHGDGIRGAWGGRHDWS